MKTTLFDAAWNKLRENANEISKSRASQRVVHDMVGILDEDINCVPPMALNNMYYRLFLKLHNRK